MNEPDDKIFFPEGYKHAENEKGENQIAKKNEWKLVHHELAKAQHKVIQWVLWWLSNIQVHLMPYPNEYNTKYLQHKDKLLSKPKFGLPRVYDNYDSVFTRDAFISNQKDTLILSNFTNTDRFEESKVIEKQLLKTLKKNNLDRKVINPLDISDKIHLEWGDFRYIPKNNILFAWLSPTGSRNNAEWVDFVRKNFNIPKKKFLIVESTSFHIDTVFSAVTDDSWQLIWWIICEGLVNNMDDVRAFFKKHKLFLETVPSEFGWDYEKDGDPRWWSINALNVNEHLISNWVFTDEVEKRLQIEGIKRYVTPTSTYRKTWWSVHCLTNQL